MRNSRPFAIGIDLGGTRLKAVAVAHDGQVLNRTRPRTHGSCGMLKPCVTAIWDTIARIETQQGRRASHVGLATPGVIDRSSRWVAWCPGKLAGIERFDWTVALNRKDPVPLLNDAHAALVAEHWVGAAAEFHYAILLTLGTGVGGAVLNEGRLLRGANGWAGALGFLSLGPFGPKSFFTVPGALEDWIGNQTVSERSRGRFQDTRQLVAAARAGNLEAKKIWRKSVRALAVAIASFAMIFDMEAAIIGGGIARLANSSLSRLPTNWTT